MLFSGEILPAYAAYARLKITENRVSARLSGTGPNQGQLLVLTEARKAANLTGRQGRSFLLVETIARTSIAKLTANIGPDHVTNQIRWCWYGWYDQRLIRRPTQLRNVVRCHPKLAHHRRPPRASGVEQFCQIEFALRQHATYLSVAQSVADTNAAAGRTAP